MLGTECYMHVKIIRGADKTNGYKGLSELQGSTAPVNVPPSGQDFNFQTNLACFNVILTRCIHNFQSHPNVTFALFKNHLRQT